MPPLLALAWKKLVRVGNLRVTTARGSTFTLGDGTGQPAAVRFRTGKAERSVLLNPELRLGEAYMNGEIVVEQGSIGDVIAILLRQLHDGRPAWARPHGRARFLYRRMLQFNTRRQARRNVAHHYDLKNELYALFLDADLQYSCAYFEKPHQSLEDAQLAKKRHLAAKLLTAKDCSVLDVGCGWGGLALYLSEICGTRVTGITLSEQQHVLAQVRAAEKGLAHRVKFRLQDYRDVADQFDRIVSVGMFEHVGLGFYDTFFRKCHALLKDDGVLLLHSIGHSKGADATNPWLAKYIFPGGYIPALSEVLPAVERAGFLVTDIEILRQHYAPTLKEWRKRFLAHGAQVEKLYDSRFVRMWEYYLAGSERVIQQQATMVFQLQLTKKQGIVPTTRDYIHREEARLRSLEAKTNNV